MPTARKSASRSGKSTVSRSNRTGRSGSKARERSQGSSRQASISSKTRLSEGKRSSANKRAGGRRAGQITIDHDEIRQWVESRDGRPGTVKGTERDSERQDFCRSIFRDTPARTRSTRSNGTSSSRNLRRRSSRSSTTRRRTASSTNL